MALPRLILMLLLTMMITTSATNMSRPGCPSSCGNVPIPYPFGIGSGCYRDKSFEITCNRTISSTISNATENNGNSSSVVTETPYLGLIGKKVFEVSLEQVRVSAWSSFFLYNLPDNVSVYAEVGGLEAPFTFSNTRNKFTAVGCDIFAYVSNTSNEGRRGREIISGCASLCSASGNIDAAARSCSGIGCCQTTIPSGLKAIILVAFNINTGAPSSNDSYSYAILHDSDLSMFNSFFRPIDSFFRPIDSSFRPIDVNVISSVFSSITSSNISSALDWAIGADTCEEAIRRKNYECQENSKCINSSNGPGYKCRCSPGFQGNPYLPNGCQDIDECSTLQGSCQAGGRDSKRPTVVIVSIGIGVGLGLLLLIAIGFWFYRAMKRRNQIKLKQKFFKRNGGFLLEQQISSGGDGNVERTKIFVTEQLERATDSFNKSRILGRGGSGTVYKGMLSDGRIVAIKKSKIIDESQIGQFINELVILSQINHRNIVRLLGCCLETDVPLLVYEYVSNGTLSHHLYSEGHFASMSWKDRLGISKEIAGALSYLHSSASVPIFHRDIKSSNILLDENFRVKVSDFGISRSVPFEKTHLTTLVQGTFGYLDPEYFHSGQFSDKSDVYSFGVVLVELLTGEKPICYTRTENEKNLAMHFISAVKEGRLLQVLEKRVVNEGDKQDLLIVAKLAKRCLKLVGKKRPTMKEVAAELEGLRSCQDQPYSIPNCEDNNHCSLEAEQLSVCISSGPNSQNSDL